MKKITLVIIAIFGLCQSLIGQHNYSYEPDDAKFITVDVEEFWRAFDSIDSLGKNTFTDYVDNGTVGLRGFIKYRIESDKALYNTVIDRKTDYLKSRNVLDDLDNKTKEIIEIYEALDKLYPDAVFPPVYFVIGRFNSGGTVSNAGIIIGTEMMENLDGLPALLAHELIHYQQNIKGDQTLLYQSLMEGSADFIGELISGSHINMVAHEYGEKYSEVLTKEFVKRMNKKKLKNWFYYTNSKDNRPNDLGYWIGYKITKAYYDKHICKKQAIFDILNINDPKEFTKKSGFFTSN